jgi:hypothetical protein
MKKDSKKIKEPFQPHGTPEPPQIKEPNGGRERENPIQDRDRKERGSENAGDQKTSKPHLLAEDSDIDDETTI